MLVTGTLVDPPDVRDTYTNLRLQTQIVDTGLDQVKVSGLLLARVGTNQDYHYGDILRLRGMLETPPSSEAFSYRDYLARQGIHSYMSRAEVTLLPGNGGSALLASIYRLRDLSLRNVYRLFVDPEASLLAGILLGVDFGIALHGSSRPSTTLEPRISSPSPASILPSSPAYSRLSSTVCSGRVAALLPL